MKNKTLTDDEKLVSYIKDLFKDSLAAAEPEFTRLQQTQDAYDCIIPPSWGTFSEIYLPVLRTATEVALPNVVEYLFPRTGGMFSFIPGAKPLPYTVVKQAEDYFEDLILNKLNAESAAVLALKDAVKHNIGYLKVEYKTITPQEEKVNAIFAQGQKMGEVATISPGQPQTVTTAKYLHWGRVVPTPDGDCPNNVTCTFELDYIRSDDLEALYDADALNSKEQQHYRGTAQEIIQNTRDRKMDGYLFPDWWVAMQITGGPSGKVNQSTINEFARRSGNPYAPVNVPVLKCYFQHEHIWVANGDTIIRHDKDTMETMACPIVKATPIPDSGKWFPRSNIDAGRDTADGKNILTNAIFDLLSHTLHPTSVVNRMIVQDDDVGLEPHGQINAYGKVGDAIDYVNPPQLPQGVLNIGADLDNTFAQTVGQPQQLQGQGTAGLMRGGMHGFEGFLQTTYARDLLAGAILETNFLKDFISLIIIHEQVRIGEAESYIVADSDKKMFVEKTITPEELRHVFNVRLTLREQFKRSASDQNHNLAVAQQLMGDSRYDRDAVVAELLLNGDRAKMRKLIASPEVQERQAQEAADKAKQEQEAKQGPRAPAADQTMAGQAARGAESQGA